MGSPPNANRPRTVCYSTVRFWSPSFCCGSYQDVVLLGPLLTCRLCVFAACVRCFARFEAMTGQCTEEIGEVNQDDCCQNPVYGYETEAGACQSCGSVHSWSGSEAGGEFTDGSLCFQASGVVPLVAVVPL